MVRVRLGNVKIGGRNVNTRHGIMGSNLFRQSTSIAPISTGHIEDMIIGMQGEISNHVAQFVRMHTLIGR
jgi:hypothetical protein